MTQKFQPFQAGEKGVIRNMVFPMSFEKHLKMALSEGMALGMYRIYGGFWNFQLGKRILQKNFFKSRGEFKEPTFKRKIINIQDFTKVNKRAVFFHLFKEFYINF